MSGIDFSKRAWDKTWHLDPIVRSLLCTDFYKLLMQQFIWEHYPNERVSFKVINRTKTVKIAKDVDLGELREQLDHVRTLHFTPSELIWLRGQSFYGQDGIFSQGYLDTLRHFQLPDYTLSETDGQIDLVFEGAWWQTSLWEIYALTIINEMRYRSIMRTMSRSQLDIMYARAKVKLYTKLERLATLPDLNISDFGTRRRHSFLWQEHCVLTAHEVLGERFTGTSNVYLAMKHGLEAKGTTAHELPMAFAAIARRQNPDIPAAMSRALKEAQYAVLQQWQNQYRGHLLVFLPDTFGTTQFLKNAPQWVSNWKGARPDSKEPISGGEELIAWWKRQGIVDEKIASEKLIIFADGLDVGINDQPARGSDIVDIYNHFHGRVGIGFGFGTNFTNDFLGCHPAGADIMKPVSLVCKAFKATTQPCIKLSDNYEKATSDFPKELKIYRDVFGTAGVENVPVTV